MTALTYRTYDLPWDATEAQDIGFRKLVKQLLIATAVFGLIMPFAPLPQKPADEVRVMPPRFAKLLLEKPAPPPPPPPVAAPKIEEPIKKPEKVVEAKPEPVKPEPVLEKPKEKPKQAAREKAAQSGLLPFANQLASLRDESSLSNVTGNQSLNKAAGEATKVERSVIASKAGASSGGISTSSMSRNTGGGNLAGRSTTQVVSPVDSISVAARGPDVVKGGSAPSRSREEIELVFEKNKGAIFALYNRALRRDPGLQGKLVLNITILPSGAVSECEVVSSELGDAELERKLVQRVKLFRFAEKDVGTITTTKPIDFFPA